MQTIGIHKLIVERRMDETNLYKLDFDERALMPMVRMPRDTPGGSAEELSDFIARYFVYSGNERLKEALDQWRTSTQTDDAGLEIKVCIVDDVFSGLPENDWKKYSANQRWFTYEFDRDGLRKVKPKPVAVSK